jgi:hypothetical protein
MYNTGVITPMSSMGLSAGVSLPFLEMSPLWMALALFALIACASAIKRILPRPSVDEKTPDRHAARTVTPMMR